MGMSSQDIQMMRLMLSQQQAPQIQLNPVNDIGGGIAQGVGNIMNAVMQRRHQAQVAAMLAQQQMAAQQAAQEAMRAKIEAYQAVGMSPAQAQVAALDEAMARQIQQQGYDVNKTVDERTYKQTERYGKALNLQSQPGYLQKPLDENGRVPLEDPGFASTLPLEQALFMVDNGGAGKLAEGQAQRENNFSNLKMLQGVDLNTPQGQLQAQAILGFAPPNSYTVQSQQAGAANAVNNAAISANTAAYAPLFSQQQLLTNDLTNEGKGTANALSGNQLQRDQALLGVQNDALANPDQTTIPALALTSGVLSDNPATSLNSMIGKDKLFRKAGDMVIPGAEMISAPVPQAPQQSMQPQAFPSLNQNLNFTPQQRGEMFRNELGAGITGTLGNAWHGLQGLRQQGGTFRDSLNKGLQGFFGLPINPGL